MHLGLLNAAGAVSSVHSLSHAKILVNSAVNVWQKQSGDVKTEALKCQEENCSPGNVSAFKHKVRKW